MSDRPEEQGAVTPHARCPARCVCAQNLTLTLTLPQRSRRRPSSLRRTQNGSRAVQTDRTAAWRRERGSFKAGSSAGRAARTRRMRRAVTGPSP